MSNKFIRVETTEAGLMDEIDRMDETGYDLLTSSLISERKFHVGETRAYDAPARFMLIFKKR
jgi:MoxR-like ATPase